MRKFKKFAVSAILIGIMCGVTACGGSDKADKEDKATEAATVEESTTDKVIDEEEVADVTEEDIEEDTEETKDTDNDTDESGAIETDYNFSSNDWKTLEFALDGEVYTFPMTYADVEAAGFVIEDDLSEILESNYYTLSYTAKNAEGEQFYVRFKNFTDTDKALKDCDIYGFSFEVQDYRDVNPDVTLCNGVTFGMTVDEVKAIMGEPDYYYESDSEYDYKSMEYYVTGKSYDSTIELWFTDGALNEITIENVD